MANREDNLIHLNERSEEDKKRIATMGGKASVEARRKKKAMREMLEACLDMKNNKGMTYRELVTMGLIKGAIKGNAQSYRTILETLGELNIQDEENKQNGVLTDLLEALNNAKKP